jgi:hypothetical protein
MGGDDNVRMLSRSMWPSFLFLLAGFAAVAIRVKLAYE